MSRLKTLRAAGKAAGRSRRLAQGATRKRAAAGKPARSFVWVNRLLVLLGVGVVLAAVAKATLVLSALPVERIVVTGKLEHTRTLEVQEMVQPALAGGFLNADLQRIRAQLESLPWVYEATVKRQWPNTLEIHVSEQLPIARWGERGFLNHEGDVFQSANAEGSDGKSLPLLSGPRGTQHKLIEGYQLLTEMLAPLDIAVSALSIDARGQLSATLGDDIDVALGDGGLRERMERFVALYRTGLARRKVAIRRVDMRYERGVAVAFKTSPDLAGL